MVVLDLIHKSIILRYAISHLGYAGMTCTDEFCFVDFAACMENEFMRINVCHMQITWLFFLYLSLIPIIVVM